MDHRVGIGYDVHRLKKGRKLMLGGIEVPHTHGLDGHSDADAVLAEQMLKQKWTDIDNIRSLRGKVSIVMNTDLSRRR